MNNPILGHYTYCSWEDYRNMKKIPTSEYLLMCCGPKKMQNKIVFFLNIFGRNFVLPSPQTKKTMICWNFADAVDIPDAVTMIDEEEVMIFLRPMQFGDGLLQYKCNLCGKCAANKSNMKKHMLVMHARPSNRPCPFCPKVFRNKYYLRYHVKICSFNPEVIAKRHTPTTGIPNSH